MSLSQRISRLVKTTGATYAALGEAVGYSPAQIGHLVTGKRTNPSVNHLTALADYFGVDFLWLAHGKGRGPTNAHLRGIAAKRGITRRGQPTARPSEEAA